MSAVGGEQAGGVFASPPRLCLIPSLAEADETLFRYVRRLHFDWVAAPALPLDQATEKTAAASMVALCVMLNVEATSLSSTTGPAFAAQVKAAGVAGIRFVGVQQFPAEWWRDFLAAARLTADGVLWVADSLGASPDQTAGLLVAGFDYFLGSVKWWDGREGWAVEQYERFRPLARSIGFPENLEGDRLVTEMRRGDQFDKGRIAALYRQRYALAAFMDAGLMMPLGFEVAADSRRVSAENPSGVDLRAAITAINRLKATQPCLSESLPLRRLPADTAIALLKQPLDGRPACCFVANPNPWDIPIDLAALALRMGLDLGGFLDVTPTKPIRLIDRPFSLGPGEWRLFIETQKIPEMRPARPARRQNQAITSGPRLFIEDVYPMLDGGRYPVKRVVGDRLEVWADILRDGHDICGAALLIRAEDEDVWSSVPVRLLDNDRWVGAVTVNRNRRHIYCVEAWTDVFASWRDRTGHKHEAGQDITLDLEEGRALIGAVTAKGNIGRTLQEIAAATGLGVSAEAKLERLFSAETAALMDEWGPREDVTRSSELALVVDRRGAAFSSWYEIFPRSQGADPARSGTFDDCIARLDDIQEMGFDVVYLTPIHPIGEINRKGRNNALTAAPGDPGSPYAIGAAAGGHDAIHPDLGTLEDFRRFVGACHERQMEVAIDFAVQCAPDHPWLKQHPEWFEFRADGSVRYAENPPKKYQDIVNLNFAVADPMPIWNALRDVVQFWVEQGVTIFRVDNPHTKPFPFWEWLIRDIQATRPDILFLAEAFTRPKPMQALAKLGFTQSYTYFTWRNEKRELIEYFTHLTQDAPKEYYRPHLFANTPDILPHFLQEGGPAAFRIRAVLAATLGGLFGIYGGFELCENEALPNSEEYADSEKYQYKIRDWNKLGNIKPLIARLNRIRQENQAFADWRSLTFLPCDNEKVLFYSRQGPSPGEEVCIAVSLDPHNAHNATIELPLSRLGMKADEGFHLEDLLTGEPQRWVGSRHTIHLDPENPAFIARLNPASTRR